MYLSVYSSAHVSNILVVDYRCPDSAETVQIGGLLHTHLCEADAHVYFSLELL